MSHKIALSGCPGAGKTTLARGLSSQIRGNTRFKTIELVDEWARTYINKYGIKDIGDQILILEKQIKDELEYKGVSVIIPRRECIQKTARTLSKAKQ